MKRVLLGEDHEIRFAEDAWLNYFNRYLLDNKVITEKEFRKMTEKIAARKAKLSLKKQAI